MCIGIKKEQNLKSSPSKQLYTQFAFKGKHWSQFFVRMTEMHRAIACVGIEEMTLMFALLYTKIFPSNTTGNFINTTYLYYHTGTSHSITVFPLRESHSNAPFLNTNQISPGLKVISVVNSLTTKPRKMEETVIDNSSSSNGCHLYFQLFL